MLTNKERPEGQREDYLFVRSVESGREFKALVAIDRTQQRDPVLKLSISEVGDDGKALRDEAGQTDIYRISHTVTQAERDAEGFDLTQTAQQLLAASVERFEEQDGALAAAKQLAAGWGSLGLTEGQP